jgi:hypothetical protein
MKGDFSRWEFDPNDNFNGVLHQQGRVFLDSDGSDLTRILNHWQETAGQDIIGSGIAAVPAQVPNAFKVTQTQAIQEGTPAVVVGATVTLLPGHLWADGLLVHLATEPDSTTLLRRADYLGTPAPLSPDGSNDRDAVILEVWQEAINGFQVPDKLLEPALGGPDTSERVQTAIALRLLRLAADETCETIGDRLRDDFESKGKLSVSLQPTTTIPGDCPVVEGGGYSGFEHSLYRLEIAQVNAAQPAQFKWSQFNGGLVGRGDCALGGPDKKITITANNQAIQSANLETFYLEVVELDPSRGYWRTTYGADVSLNGDLLEVSTERYTETTLPTNNVFFRLWNGIRPISDFPVVTPPVELQDGIRLAFEAVTPGKYTPGDYWTFKLRAGEIANPELLLDRAPPTGIHYHRVPLAELHWNIGGQLALESPQIEDCRRIFRPLTNQRVCCTILVGDGIRSQGDFNSIEEALTHLPPQGGKICLLPGVHRTNAVIQRRQNIRITGCGPHTIVQPRPNQPTDPIFRIASSQAIQLDAMTLMTNTGTAIQVRDAEPSSPPIAIRAVAARDASSQGIAIRNNRIVALTHAVEVRVLEQAGNNDIWIAENTIAMLDRPDGDVAIFSNGDGVLIERNQIVVVAAPDPQNPGDPRPPGDPSISVFDPCAKPTAAYVGGFPLRRFIASTFRYVSFAVSSAVLPRIYQTRSGIQIAGGSEDVTICHNQIIGGKGNGITLGDLPAVEVDGVSLGRSLTYEQVPEALLSQLQQQFKSTLYSIAIEENTIQSMGLAGIGVEAFFSLRRVGLLIRVEDLTIYRNSISHCAQQTPEDLPETLLGEIGFGGIVLTDCENALIQENRIEHNGINHLNPICGILILMGEKIEISNNRILDNGPRTSLTNDNVRRGLRGGVVVAMSFKALNSKQISDTDLLSPDGIPAVKVHDNIITQPLGQALILLAMGPISVVGNQLTSQGADFRVNPLSLMAGTIYILDLGISQDLIALLLLASFRNLAAQNNATLQANYRPTVANTLRRLLYLPSGTVLFANNQITLDLRTDEINLALSSILIASLDDVAFNSNQSNCNSLIDVILFDTVLFAVTVRSNDNRFQEGISMTFYSLFSYGFMNTATSNQSTHCLHVLGSLPIEADNRVLFTYNCRDDNQRFKQSFGGITTTISG